MSNRLCRTLAALFILAVAAVRIAYLGWYSPLGLAPDEAHYWDWSRHLDWHYYSKPPMVALLIRISLKLFGPLSLALTGSEVLAVRLPAVVCGSMMTVALYVLTTQIWKRETWSLAIVVIAAMFPMVAAGSSLITIDSPLTCFWAWALVFGFEAIVNDRRWIATGVFVALGLMSKPTMVLFVPCLGLLLLTTPELRSRLWTRRFWAMVGVAFLGTLPLLIWNALNGWVTILHTMEQHIRIGHVRVDNPAPSWRPLGPLVYIGTQAGILLVYWFAAWALAMWRYRPTVETRLEQRYLWWMSVPVFVFFGLFSLKNGGGEPNWPVVCYLSGMVLAVGWLNEQLQSKSKWYCGSTIVGVVLVTGLGLAGTIVLHLPRHCQPMFLGLASLTKKFDPMPLRKFDPTVRLRGAKTLADAIDEFRRERELPPDTVLAAGHWTLPGQVAFYLPDHPTVYSLGVALGDRQSQYDLWHPNPVADPDQFRGKTFLLIDIVNPKASDAFESVEFPFREVEYREDGQLVARWFLTVGRGYKGFPAPKAVNH